MKFGKIGWILVVFLAANSYAEDSISSRAISVQSKLEVLNNLGRECEVQLQVNGMNGSSSKDCEKYLKNIRGEYFKSLGQECVELSNWYETKRKMIISNPAYADDHPSEASQLVKDMKAVQKSCNPQNMSSYTYLTKPLDTIKALSELQ